MALLSASHLQGDWFSAESQYYIEPSIEHITCLIARTNYTNYNVDLPFVHGSRREFSFNAVSTIAFFIDIVSLRTIHYIGIIIASRRGDSNKEKSPTRFKILGFIEIYKIFRFLEIYTVINTLVLCMV